MTMQVFDGFDWYGDNEQDSETILLELASRGWIGFGGVEAEVKDPSPIWDPTQLGPAMVSGDYLYKPLGRAIKLSGTAGGYIMKGCKPWIDTAVGLNIVFETIPTGGPHKLIEIVQWGGAAYNVLYTLAILNGSLYSYAYGEVGVGSHLQDGTTFFLGTLSPGQVYSLHYYARRSLRILWVDGEIQGYWGGYSGLQSNHAVRIYNTGAPTIDDAYFTHTQPERWPGAWDTLLGYDWIEDGTLYRHKVLTPKAELEIANEWTTEGGPLSASLKGGSDTYSWVNAMLRKEFATHNEDVGFPCPPLYNYHVQGAGCAKREGNVRNRVHFEGRYPGYDSGASIMGIVSYYIHNDTVACGTEPLAPGPRDLQRLVNRVTAMAVNRQLTSTPAHLNNIDWWGRTWERPAIFGAST
jgi:hypothetical protein